MHLVKQERAVSEAKQQYKTEILTQVATNEKRKVKEKKERLSECVQDQQKLEGQKQRLEAIKQRKIEELKSSGVPSKYIAELTRKRIAI